ncbi:MAG TPA: hypothetical protein VIL36_05180 [Acidimicrobiales bacterium]
MWARRQLHETTIHRIDAEAAAGRRTVPATDVAADGIDELLTCFVTRRRSRFRLDPPRRIAVEAVDLEEAAWTLTISLEPIVTVPGADPAADLLVRGPASDLYLWLWNRAPADGLDVKGDPALLAAWREHVQVSWS